MDYRRPVWIDTDVSIGVEYPDKPGHYHDIDDALAMISCFNSNLIAVKGVSATFGNIDTDTSYSLSKKITRKFGRAGTPVVKGASGPIVDGKLPETAGADAMALELQKGSMKIVSLGAATNVAILIKKYPHLLDQVVELVAMAGSRRSPQDHFFAGPKQDKPFRALNFESDVEAWEIILASTIPITFAPFEVSHKVWITHEDVEKMEKGAGKSGKYLAPHMRQWANEWTEIWGAPGFNPFDALATGYLIAPSLFTSELLPVGIIEYPDDTQDFVEGEPPIFKPYLIVSKEEKEIKDNRRATYLYDVNRGFKPFLLDTLRGNFNMALQVVAVSHINVIVDDVDKAAEFYQRALGFEKAYGSNGDAVDFTNYCDPAFARDAGFLDGKVNIDVRFVRHPQADICIEIMKYNYPKGEKTIHFHKTNDMGGPRHIAMEVADIGAVFKHLKQQPEVQMINSSPEYDIPEELDNTEISFFYWLDPYGIQWEMESGRPIGYGRDIAL